MTARRDYDNLEWFNQDQEERYAWAMRKYWAKTAEIGIYDIHGRYKPDKEHYVSLEGEVTKNFAVPVEGPFGFKNGLPFEQLQGVKSVKVAGRRRWVKLYLREKYRHFEALVNKHTPPRYPNPSHPRKAHLQPGFIVGVTGIGGDWEFYHRAYILSVKENSPNDMIYKVRTIDLGGIAEVKYCQIRYLPLEYLTFGDDGEDDHLSDGSGDSGSGSEALR